MAATDKQQLLQLTHGEFAKLDKLIGGIDAQTALTKDENDISIKDIVGHRAHWIDLFIGWYRDGQAGKPVHFPAPGYKWNQLKAYNARLRADQSHLGWEEARTLLNRKHRDLLALVEGLDQAALYGGPMQGANNDWTAGRWAEASGPSHYRSAAKYIRARLRGQ